METFSQTIDCHTIWHKGHKGHHRYSYVCTSYIDS